MIGLQLWLALLEFNVRLATLWLDGARRPRIVCFTVIDGDLADD